MLRGRGGERGRTVWESLVERSGGGVIETFCGEKKG